MDASAVHDANTLDGVPGAKHAETSTDRGAEGDGKDSADTMCACEVVGGDTNLAVCDAAVLEEYTHSVKRLTRGDITQIHTVVSCIYAFITAGVDGCTSQAELVRNLSMRAHALIRPLFDDAQGTLEQVQEEREGARDRRAEANSQNDSTLQNSTVVLGVTIVAAKLPWVMCALVHASIVAMERNAQTAALTVLFLCTSYDNLKYNTTLICASLILRVVRGRV